MKVVLLEDVRKVGKKGDVVNVSDGYGQNFLIKNKLAVKETAGSKKILEQQKEEAKQDDTEKIKSVIQEFLSLNKLTSEIMKVIINRIEIHQDKQVDLYFNFKQLNNLKEKI